MSDERARDPQGRPRNDRPRDGLGRPLPRGSAGVEPESEDLVLAPREALRRAQQLLDAGRPFHAHEVLEASWKAAPSAERDLWQGLAQLAVGLTHALRGNPTGALRLLARGSGRIAGYVADPPHEVAVAGLLAWADETARRIATTPAGSARSPALPPPTLRCAPEDRGIAQSL